MEEKVLFRNKGRGYNKDDVNEYITAENKKFSELEFGLKKTIAEKDKAISGFTDELFRKNSELTELKNTVIQKDRAIGELKATIEEKDSAASALQSKLDSLENELKQRELKIKELMENPVAVVAPSAEATVQAKPEPVIEEPKQEPQLETVEEPVAQEPITEEAVAEEPAKAEPEAVVFAEPVAEAEPVAVSETAAPATEAASAVADIAEPIKAEAQNAAADMSDYSIVSVEQVKSQVDEILNYARKEAFNILNAAQESAHRVAVPRSQFESIKKDISGRSANIISEIKKTSRMKRR